MTRGKSFSIAVLVKKRRVVLSFLLSFVLLRPGTPLFAGVETVRPDPSKAVVCFYREAAFEGNWFRYGLTDGGAPIGSLPAESFLYCQVEPGEHVFQLASLRRGSTKLRVQGGHLYYFRCLPAAAAADVQSQLELVPVIEGAAVVATLRPGRVAR